MFRKTHLTRNNFLQEFHKKNSIFFTHTFTAQSDTKPIKKLNTFIYSENTTTQYFYYKKKTLYTNKKTATLLFNLAAILCEIPHHQHLLTLRQPYYSHHPHLQPRAFAIFPGNLCPELMQRCTGGVQKTAFSTEASGLRRPFFPVIIERRFSIYAPAYICKSRLPFLSRIIALYGV